jgi:carboxymethylenebutenolidase
VNVAVDTVEYASGAADAPRLRGEVVRPTAAGRRPGIVLLHGSVGCWLPGDVELLGRTFAARGYVAFFPCRRGQGLSAGRGEAVMDQLRREGVLARDSAYAARSTELLGTTQLADVRGAIAWLRARPEVDAARVAVAGISYGGILTLLAAEADSTLRAAVSFAPAAMNWGWNAPLRERLTAAARRTRVPILFAQAENDWHLGPVEALPAAVRAGGGDGTGRVYPALGGNVASGHGLMVLAPDVWRDDVLAFLDRHMGRRP